MESSTLEFIWHTSTLAWQIPWTEEPGRLQSVGLLRIGHDWASSLPLFASCIGEGNGNPLQCSCLENPRDWEAWWAAVHGVAQNQTRLKWLSSSKGYKKQLSVKMSFNLWETESHHFNFVCLFDFWIWLAGFPETSPEIPLYNQVDQRRQWHPTPVLLPGKSHGSRSLVGCSPWGH